MACIATICHMSPQAILPSVVHLEHCLIRSPLKALKSKLRTPKEKKTHWEMSAATDGNKKGHDSLPAFGQQLF